MDATTLTMPPLLLIPGNMCDARLWAPVAERLEASGHCVRHAPLLDQPSIAAMAAAVLAEQEGPIAIVGFSMGAIVAAEIARVAPDRVVALGLIAFNASADLPERAAVRPRQQADVRAGRLAAVVADELKPNYLAAENRDDATLLDLTMAMALDLGPEVFVRQSEALRTRADLRPALPGFRMPVMLACGAEDRLCPPAWHHDWARLIGSNAHVEVIGSAGHLLPLEQPDALATIIRHWHEAPCPAS